LSRNVSQDFTIEFDASFLQAVHKLAVAQAILARCRIDPDNPQAAEISLAVAAIAVSVDQGLHHGLIAALKQAMLTAPLAFGQS
jgi:hypothetical protein